MAHVAVDRGGKIEAWAVQHGMYPSNLTSVMEVPRYRMLNEHKKVMDEMSPIGVQKTMDQLNLALYGLSNPSPDNIAAILRKLFQKKIALRLEQFYLTYLPNMRAVYEQTIRAENLKWLNELADWKPLVSDMPLSMKESFPVAVVGDFWLRELRNNFAVNSTIEDLIIVLNYFTNIHIQSAIQALYKEDAFFARNIEKFNSGLTVSFELLGSILKTPEDKWTLDDLKFVHQWIYNKIAVEAAPVWHPIQSYQALFNSINTEVINGFAIIALAYTRLLINKNSWLIGKHSEIYLAFYGVFAAIYKHLSVPEFAGSETPEENKAFEKHLKTLRTHMIVAATKPLNFTLKKGDRIPYEDDVDNFLGNLKDIKNFAVTSSTRLGALRAGSTSKPNIIYERFNEVIHDEFAIFDKMYIPVFRLFANIYN